MEISMCVYLFLLAIYAFHNVNCVCTLNIKKDFGTPPAVYLRDGQYLTPVNNSEILLQRSEVVQIACPGSRRHVVIGNITTGYDFVEAHCILNTTVRVDRWIGNFVDINCNMQPSPSIVETKEKCHDNNEIIRVGYEIRKKFYPLYEACYDRYQMRTLYVKHHLTPANVFKQSNYGNQKFVDNLNHNNVINNAYKKQAERIDALLGVGMSKKYITRKQFLARGHLAARSDFTMRSHQHASYQYMNSAPQWQRGNNGDWSALENALREHVHKQGNAVMVYTGTAGVLALPDSKGKLQELYLAVDENNNGVVPVPLYFFKLVYDPKQKSAAAFLSINSGFFNQTSSFETMNGMNDCSRHPWLHWNPRDGTDSFCLQYKELAAKIPHVPRLDVRTLYY